MSIKRSKVQGVFTCLKTSQDNALRPKDTFTLMENQRKSVIISI